MSNKQFDELNKSIFNAVKNLHLPSGHFAITSSGPMGIRGLRLINDADLIVDDYLWDILSKEHKPEIDNGLSKIVLSAGLVEVLGKGSFFNNYDQEDPTIDHQIKTAEIIDGLPYVRLEFIRFFKQKLGREKDLKDIILIDNYLATS